MQTSEVLPPEGRSASRARRVVESALRDARLGGFVDEALLLVTEVVTNAVVHAGTDIELTVVTGEADVRVDVVDYSGEAMPVLHSMPGEEREGGRGIYLLDALSTEWGTRHFATGKSVWFTLGASPTPVPARNVPAQPTPTRPPRRDIDWLVGLPVELERQLRPEEFVAELLHRLTEGLGLSSGWVYADSPEGGGWALLTASDPIRSVPDPEAVRRVATGSAGAATAGPDGALVLPLRHRAGVFGAVLLAAGAQSCADDVALARLVSDRVSVILREDQANAALLRGRGSLGLLAEASEMFAGTLDVELAVTLATQLVVPRFAAWSAALTAYDHQPKLVAVAHSDEVRLASLRSALCEGEGQDWAAHLLADPAEHRPVIVPAEKVPESLAGEGGGDVLALPLVARRRVLGLLLLGQRRKGSYGAQDVGVLTDLADRAALAVDNARLYEDHTAISHALQASLLPASLPTGPGVDFAARYAAAGDGNEVGGDFYDVFTLPAGGWGISIGDVCGTGAEAAAITGTARSVLRLLVRDGSGPDEALRRLNDVILDLGERGRFCTTMVGVVTSRGDGLAVQMTSAGHPPAVLVTRSGHVSCVGRSGTLLGVVADVELVRDEVLLAPGDALVCYTDGLTERRHGNDLFGEERLLASLRALAGEPADRMAGGLEAAVTDYGAGASRDDLAVLVVRCSEPAAAR